MVTNLLGWALAAGVTTVWGHAGTGFSAGSGFGKGNFELGPLVTGDFHVRPAKFFGLAFPVTVNFPGGVWALATGGEARIFFGGPEAVAQPYLTAGGGMYYISCGG